jgi:hypothetical protein
MDRQPYLSAGFDFFCALGMLLVAWRIAPAPYEHWLVWAIFALLLGIGTYRVLDRFLLMQRVRGPRPVSLVPAGWLSAWVGIAILATSYGTPHLRVEEARQACGYVGWNGYVAVPNGSCDLVVLVPLPKDGLGGL